MTRLSIILVALSLGACGEPEAAPPAPQHDHGAHQHQAEPAPDAETPAAPVVEAVVHTCPMHPEVRQDGPGSCPTCGMDLVPAAQGEEAEAHHSHDHAGHEGHDH